MASEANLDHQAAAVFPHPSRLIGGMSREVFNLEVRELSARHSRTAFDSETLARLFDIPRLEELLETERVPGSHIDVITGGLPKRLVDLQRGTNKSNLEMVTGSLRRGATIRISDIQRFHPPLQTFAQSVATFFAASSQINLYLTPPGRKGFEPHFDTTDVFIVQCVGSKEWTLFQDYSSSVATPLLATPWDPDKYVPGSPGEQLHLQAGDVLYVPRGVMHSARCVGEPSAHLTVSVAPLTAFDVFVEEIRLRAENDVGLRRRLDWAIDQSPERLELLNIELRRQFVELAQGFDLAPILSNEVRNLRGDSQQAGPVGRLEMAFYQ